MEDGVIEISKKEGFLNLSGKLSGDLPEEICSLTELEAINLSNNQLTSLPEGFEKLSKLKFLNLSNNRS